MRTFTPLLLLLLIQVLLFAQGTTYGTITDATSGKVLIGVNVVIKGTGLGIASDQNGQYQIQNDGQTLEFSYIGYKPLSFENVAGKLDVGMEADATLLSGNDGGIILVTDKRISDAHNYTLLATKELQLQNQTDFVPIINTSPGVFMHSGTLNTNRIVIRGIGSRSPFSTNKIKAYLDDIPLTNGSGETTIEDIDLSFLKNIEIWKGPTSSRFGAGLGGAIVLNSNFQQESYASVQHTIGDFGLHRNVVDLHWANVKKGSHFHLNHNLTDSEGYRDNNQYRRQGLTFLSSQAIQNDELKVFVNATRIKAYIPSSLNETDFLNEPQKAAFTWAQVSGFEDYERLLAGVSYKQDIKNKARLIYSVFLNNRRAYELRPFNILTENSMASGLRMLFHWHEKPKWVFRIGTELFSESYDWSTYATNDAGALLDPLSINAETRLYGNVFTENILRISDKFKLNAGLNLNATNYQLEDRYAPDSINRSGDYSFDPVLSPRLTFNYTPRNNNDYYVLLSHGFSPPSLEETLSPDGSINPDIQPETAWNLELGTRFYDSSLPFQYELGVYQMWVSNLLVPKRIDLDQYVGVNAGKTLHRGMEFQAAYDFFRKEEQKLRLQCSYTLSDFTFSEFETDGQNYKGNELPGVPRHQFSSVLFGQWFGFYGNINTMYVSRQALRDDNSVYAEGYTLLHGKAGYRFSLATHWELDFNVGVNNVLDKRYAGMHQINASGFGGTAPRYYYPGLPRHFYGGIRVKYAFGYNL